MAEDSGGDHPPILTLLDTYDRYPGALEYDWRTRFGVPWSDVPDVMDWGEAWRLFEILCTDGSSQTASKLAGWSYPFGRDVQVLADLYDLTHHAAAGKRKPQGYARPWDKRVVKFGSSSKLSQADIRTALRAHGHYS